MKNILLSLIIFFTFLFTVFGEINMYTIEDIYKKPSLQGKFRNYKWIKNSNSLLFLDNDIIYYLDAERKNYSPLIKNTEFGGNIKINNYIFDDNFTKVIVKTNEGYFLYDLGNKKVEKMEDNISYLSFSPDSNFISYIKDYNLCFFNISNKKITEVTYDGNVEIMNGLIDWVYGEEIYGRSDPNGYEWSSDSKYIAFYRMIEKDVKRIPILEKNSPYEKINYQYYPTAGTKNPVVLIMLYSLQENRIFPVISSAEFEENGYIPYYAFNKNSDKLYVFYLNRNQTKLEVYLYDIKNNIKKIIFQDEDPQWLNVQDTKNLFHPLNGDNFIIASEQDGFRHLYLVMNKEIKKITEGKYQVEALNFVDEDKKLIYFTATIESPIERHLYSINLDGSDLKKISNEKGTHSISFGDNEKYYVDYYSNITRPTKVLIHTVDGSPYLMLDENKAPILEYNILTPEIFTFNDNDGNIFYGQMIKPVNFDNTKKYPLILYVYGGPGSQSVRDVWGGSRYLFNQILANKGYVIFTMDNRGSYGRGREWENVLYKEFGKNELEDQLKGIEYIKSLGFIDENRIGIWGWSYGGYFTTYAMARRPDIFKVGVAGAPVIDWKNYDTIYTERYLKLPQNNEKGYMQSSPLNYIENLSGNYLIIHGTADDNVHIQNSIQLISKAVELNKMINVMIYPGEMHGFGDISSIHLYNYILEFFLSHL